MMNPLCSCCHTFDEILLVLGWYSKPLPFSENSFYLVKKLLCIVSFIFVYYGFFYFLFSPPYYSIGVLWINWQKPFITFFPLFVHTNFFSPSICTPSTFLFSKSIRYSLPLFLQEKEGTCLLKHI
jgi:hypothetical protein